MGRSALFPLELSLAGPMDPTLETGMEALRTLLQREEAYARRLVLLDEVSPEELETEIARFHTTVLLEHAERLGPRLDRILRSPDAGAPRQELARRLAQDHQRLATSENQLRWYLGIVEREPHGGNRQALGQYWRVLLEALERHRDEELALLGDPDASPR